MSHLSTRLRGPDLLKVLALACLAFSNLSCPVAHVSTTDDTTHGAQDYAPPDLEDETVDVGADTDPFEEISEPDATGADVTIDDLFEELRLGQLVPLETGPMARFFSALDDIKDKKSSRLVRVLHYGDSHTAADVLPSSIRRELQKRFGSGGRGFVFLGKPWRTYRPLDVEIGAKGDWRTHRIFLGRDPASMDGRYGLGGVAVDSSQPGAQVSVATDKGSFFGNTASRFDIFYLKHPAGGCFTAYVDDQKYKRVCTHADQMRTGVLSIRLKEKPHRVELSLEGRKRVRLFGATVERKGPGVVYDVLGINGAFFYTPLRWDAALLAEQVARRNPDLIVTMYGANEADSKSLTSKNYMRRVKQALERLRAGAEDASCLLLGPMDRVIPRTGSEEDRLDLISRVQQEAADEVGCSFMSLRELMGGPGSFDKWQQRGLAQADGVHLTVPGYRLMGEAIGRQLLDRYDQYRAKEMMRPPKTEPTPSGETREGGTP